MFNWLSGMFGGTQESEAFRPVLLGVIAIGAFIVSLLCVLLAISLAGEWAGPLALIVTSILRGNRRGKIEDEEVNKSLEIGYWLSIAITGFMIYRGGMFTKLVLYPDHLLVVMSRHSFTLPLWANDYRWIVVAASIFSIFVCIVIIVRATTEIIFPSLPNSVRAKPGFLARIFPFLNIKYRQEEDEEDEGAMPVSSGTAPKRARKKYRAN